MRTLEIHQFYESVHVPSCILSLPGGVFNICLPQRQAKVKVWLPCPVTYSLETPSTGMWRCTHKPWIFIQFVNCYSFRSITCYSIWNLKAAFIVHVCNTQRDRLSIKAGQQTARTFWARHYHFLPLNGWCIVMESTASQCNVIRPSKKCIGC